MFLIRKLAVAAIAAMALALTQLPASAQQVLYGVTGAGESASSLYTIDPGTGAATLVGPINFNEVVSIDFDPISGMLYGIANNGFDIPNTLITIDTTTGAGTAVATMTYVTVEDPGAEPKSPDMSFDSSGVLYTWTEALNDNLAIVNLTTGVATEVDDSGLSTAGVGLDVDSTDTIYLKDRDGGAIYTIDAGSSQPTFLVGLPGGFDNVLAFDENDVAYTVDRVGGNTNSNLYTINLTTGATTLVGSSTGLGTLAALAFGPGSIVDPKIDINIDVKPGTEVNDINLCSNGAVPVAILGSDTFDVLDVDTETLRFADAEVKVVGKKDPHTLCSYEDVNGDLEIDLVCHFVTSDIAALDGLLTSATVQGALTDMTPIEGSDSIVIVKDTCN